MKTKTQKLFICILAMVCCLSVLLALTGCKKSYDMSQVTFTDKTVEYNRQKQSIAVEGTLPEGVSVAYSYYSDAEHTKRVNAAVSVGTYYVVASFTGEEGYQTIGDMTATLTIIEGNYDLSEIKFENKVVQYSGQPQTIAITGGGTLPVGVKVSYKYYLDANHTNEVDAANVVNVGTYYVVASFVGAEGYNKPADMTATLTISKLDLSGISFTDKEVQYTGEPQTITISGQLPNALTVSYEYYSDDKYTVKVDEDKVVGAGIYYVKAIIAGKDSAEQETLTAKLTIKPVAPGTIVLADKTVNYNGQTQSAAINGELPSGVTVTYRYYLDAKRTQIAESVIDAGVYYVTATFQSNGSYIVPDDIDATLTINKVVYDSVDFTLKGIYSEGEETSTTTNVRQESEDTWYVEYQAEDCAIRLDTYVADSDSTIRPKIKYFRTMNADGTLSDETPTNNSVTNLGDTLYVQATFSDKNHTDTVLVKKVTVLKKTYELSTFEDLKIMRAHIFGGTVNGQTIEPLARGFRKDVRYVLKNDIDCQGQAWTPVQIAVKGSITASVMETNAFCSEFDGKGYTISNYKITSESLDMDEIKNQQIDAVTRVHVGFFGYVNECEIHDVTFSNVNITLDKTFLEQDFSNANVPNSGTADVIYYVGIVAGRVDSSKSQAFNNPSDLYNITVSNCKVNLEGKRIYSGGIIGIEYIGPGQGKVNLFGKRDNLNVVDCSMYASRTSGASEVAMGGIIGRIAFDSTGPDSTYVITDSTVKNIKIGYNVEAYLSADEADKEALLPASSISVGAYFGNIPLLNMQLNGCSLENYLIGTGTKTGLTSYKGGLKIDEETIVYLPIKTSNFERKQDAAWNGGVNGAYNMAGEKIEENDNNAASFDWGAEA